MAELTLKEVEVGNVIKIVLLNRVEFKGIYIGSVKYNNPNDEWDTVDKGHFLLTYNVLEMRPQIINIPFYIKQNKTRVKELSRTRLGKDLSEYLRKYAMHYHKQQTVLKQIHELHAQNVKLEGIIKKIETDGQLIQLPDSELTGHELVRKYIIQQYNNYYGKNKDIQVRLYGRRMELHLNAFQIQAREVGLIHDFDVTGGSEYRGQLKFTDGLERKLKRVYPNITKTVVQTFINQVNELEGITIEPAGDLDMYKVTMGEYDGDGSLAISLLFTVSNTFTEVDELSNIVTTFLQKVTK